MENCPHRVIRKKITADPHQYAFNAYVCGQCAQIFEVKEYHEPELAPREPMFDRRKPWGLRDRQA